MKVFLVALWIAMLAVPAYAQSQVKQQTPGPPPKPPKSPQEMQAERAAEQAYQKSLGNIPDQPPADPWGIARSADTKAAAKAPKKKPAGE